MNVEHKKGRKHLVTTKLNAYFFMEKELQNDNQQILTNQMFSNGQQLQMLCLFYY